MVTIEGDCERSTCSDPAQQRTNRHGLNGLLFDGAAKQKSVWQTAHAAT